MSLHADGYAMITAQCTRTHKKMLHALQAHYGCSGSEVIRELIETAYYEHIDGGELKATTRRFLHTDGRVYPK